MDGLEHMHFGRYVLQPKQPHRKNSDLPPSRPKRRESGERRTTSRSRASSACEACRQRKTKCSGSPGPCTICRKLDTICKFNVKPDPRRKRMHSSDVISKRRRYILDGIFLILKYNNIEDVQIFIQLIRDNASPEEILRCIKANMQSLHDHGFLEYQAIEDADFIALIPRALLNSRAARKKSLHRAEIKQSSPTAGSWATDLGAPHTDYDMTESTVSDDDIMMLLNGTDTWKTLSEDQTYENPGEFFESLGVDDDDISSYDPPSETTAANMAAPQARDTTATPSAERSFRHLTRSDEHYTPTSISSPFSVGARHASTGIPTKEACSALDRSILSFVDCARHLMSMGMALEQLNNFGKADCELLFRDRIAHDEFTIPNWACETARHFPILLPETRIALAICLIRFMPYLIHPCAETLEALPGILRPTEVQRKLAHRIEYNFVPIPKLRNCLIDYPTEWIAQLGIHKCSVGWSGVFGDTGGATLSVAGNWSYNPHVVLMERLHLGETFNEAKQAKIIVRDPGTGRCYISKQFERACWAFDNWSIDKSVLNVWPDLSGHIRVQ